MLFIDAEGTQRQLETRRELAQIGYLQCDDGHKKRAAFWSFALKRYTGQRYRVLELISRFSFNIAYMSSRRRTVLIISISKWALWPKKKKPHKRLLAGAEKAVYGARAGL